MSIGEALPRLGRKLVSVLLLFLSVLHKLEYYSFLEVVKGYLPDG